MATCELTHLKILPQNDLLYLLQGFPRQLHSCEANTHLFQYDSLQIRGKQKCICNKIVQGKTINILCLRQFCKPAAIIQIMKVNRFICASLTQ